ncbi:MAG: hypothetical protein M1596_05875 [Firmicutes bacterium]|nr:hypothetical protein [Bacillota bacterium]
MTAWDSLFQCRKKTYEELFMETGQENGGGFIKSCAFGHIPEEKGEAGARVLFWLATAALSRIKR